MKSSTIHYRFEKQTKKLISHMLWGTVFLVAIIPLVFLLFDMSKLNALPILKDMQGINFVLGFIAVPSCLLYYYMYKNDEFFILTLSYISIWIEYLAINFFLSNTPSNHALIFPFLTRVVFLTLAIFNESSASKSIVNKKRLWVILATLINIFGVFLEINLNISFISFPHINNNYLAIIFDLVIISYYYYLLIRLSKRCIIKNEFIYTIIIASISIFTIRRVHYFIFFNKSYNQVIIYNSILSFIGFLILLIGLYVEVVRKIDEGERLNSYVKDTKKKYTHIKEVEKIRTQFFANLSHEIRTPINIIYSCIQLLEVKKKIGAIALAESYEKYDTTIKQNCYRMLRLVNNLVDITKIDSGFMTMHFANYEIVSLIEDITLSIVPYIESKQINVVFDTFIEELEIKCDPESIERVILNLLSNSVKFTNIGGNILVTLNSDENWVTISIKDDGVGIPNNLKDIIFERFVQADKSLSREKEGSGIGLALVKSLVELHHGSVYINKEITVGSEFIIKLPNKKLQENIQRSNELESINKSIIDKIHIEFSDIYELY